MDKRFAQRIGVTIAFIVFMYSGLTIGIRPTDNRYAFPYAFIFAFETYFGVMLVLYVISEVMIAVRKKKNARATYARRK